MGPRLRNLLLAASLANLSFLRVWGEILQSGTPSAYYLLLGPKDVLAALLAAGLLAGAFFAGAEVARTKGGAWRVVAVVAFSVFFLLLLNRIRLDVLGLGIGAVRVAWTERPALVVLAAVIAAACTALACRRPRAALATVLTLLLVGSPFAAIVVAQCALAMVRLARLPEGAPDLSHAKDGPDGTRVLVVVFDELDRRLLFDERPEGLALPAFDALRATSADFTAVAAAGADTLYAIPSLVSGRRFSAAKPLSADDLELLVAGAKPEQRVRWREQVSVFADVHTAGGTTIAVGLYHPYCRVFAEHLDACFSEPVGITSAIGRNESFAGSFAGTLATLLPHVETRLRHAASHRQLLSRAEDAVVHRGRGLTWVHLAVPHGPWIWDRTRGAPEWFRTAPSGYLDNLVLADLSLARLRARMEQAGVWNETAVIVTADHPWRVSTTFDGRSDPRVPLLVKLPGQSGAATIPAPFDAVRIRELAGRLLAGEVRDPASLQALVGPGDVASEPAAPVVVH